jgi:hypothetical protein
MAARAHWFDDEEEASDDADDSETPADDASGEEPAANA